MGSDFCAGGPKPSRDGGFIRLPVPSVKESIGPETAAPDDVKKRVFDPSETRFLTPKIAFLATTLGRANDAELY